MWRMVLRDLQWRRRRFLLGGGATGFVFGLTLLLSGVSAAVDHEITRTVQRFDADVWVMAHEGTGPFTSAPQIRDEFVAAVAGSPGVEQAEPVLLLRSTIVGDGIDDVNLIGLPADARGWPEVTDGRDRPGAAGQVVVDASLGLQVGDVVRLSGHPLEVAGVADDVSYSFGLPTVFGLLDDVRAVTLAGAPLTTSVVVRGEPTALPDGAIGLGNQAVQDDMARPIGRATDSIDLVLVLLTIGAAGIIGLVIYLSTIERTADLAVLSATGSPRRFIAAGLVIQALLVSLSAAVLGVVLARALSGVFPVELIIERATYLRLLVLAVVVGVMASVAGVWRAIRVDPAMAFGGP